MSFDASIDSLFSIIIEGSIDLPGVLRNDKLCVSVCVNGSPDCRVAEVEEAFCFVSITTS